MFRIFGKDNLLDGIRHYGFPILVAGAFSLLLCPERHAVHVLLGITCMYFWIYWIHRALHWLPTEGPFRYINTHWIFHHQPLKILDRRVELALETVNDMAMSLCVAVLQYATGLWIVPFSIVLYHAFMYTSVHIVNYSILGSDTHRDHHKNVGTNFGPDAVDQLFGTNHTPNKEDMVPMMVNSLLAFGAVLCLKQYVDWKD